MIKRIALIGASQQNEAALAKAARGKDVLITPMQPGETPPHGAMALIALEEHAVAALDAALSVCAGQEALLGLLADAIACRENIPLGASERVRQHAARFAQALGLDPETQLTLERGALLRDIGKLKIPNDVLLKKSVLSYDDWLLLQAHTKLGAELLEERRVFTDILDIVHYHHECYDGDGYPGNLEGGDIPRLARIMKIIDVYCAMTSPRHYRESQPSHDDAIEYLKSERGKHYDPKLLDVFLEAEVGQPRKA